MPRKSKNKFDVVNGEIHITKEGWPIIGMTTYREDYYEEITSKTWTLSDKDGNGYLSNGTLGPLHRYIVAKWYGELFLKEMTENGYVVDHMNNIHSDCRISNLEFLKKAYNTAKGQTFDKDSKVIEHHIAVNIFKDFYTGYYQMTIGCNDYITGIAKDGTKYRITAIALLYDCDYSIVINDAENIIRVYETEGRIDLGKTYACDFNIKRAVDIKLTEEEKNNTIIIRNGVPYLILDTGKAILKSVHYLEGWKPPKK